MVYPERASRRPDDVRSDAQAAADAEALARTVPEYVTAQETVARRKRPLTLIGLVAGLFRPGFLWLWRNFRPRREPNGG